MSRGKVIVFGAGFVGLATAAAALHAGWSVTVLDTDAARIAAHRQDVEAGRDPLGEPEMRVALGRGGSERHFVVLVHYDPVAAHLDDLVRGSVVVCAVGTPLAEDGHGTDSSAVFAVARTAAAHGARVFVLRSTVAAKILRQLRAVLDGVPLVVAPEFLREGHAVSDALNPGRVVVGADTDDWRSWGRMFLACGTPRARVTTMVPEEASLVKLAANTALSLRVWLADATASACEGVPGADARRVLEAVYSDARIGIPGTPGLGAAGPCLPKDVVAFGAETGSRLMMATLRREHEQPPSRLTRRILDALSRTDPGVTVTNPRIVVLGVGFKPDSADWRGSPVLDLVRQMTSWAEVEVYDDRVPDHERDAFNDATAGLLRPRGEVPAPMPAVFVPLAAVPLDRIARTLRPRIVADPYRLTSPDEWPAGTEYLGGGAGPLG